MIFFFTLDTSQRPFSKGGGGGEGGRRRGRIKRENLWASAHVHGVHSVHVQFWALLSVFLLPPSPPPRRVESLGFNSPRLLPPSPS